MSLLLYKKCVGFCVGSDGSWAFQEVLNYKKN